MSVLIVVLRLIHILSGVFWAGSLFMMAGFIQPAAKATGPESNKFMQRLLGGHLAFLLTLTPPLTVLAGLTLYWIDSAGLRPEWIATPSGVGFTVGGLAGLTALLFGAGPTRITANKLTALGRELHAAATPPTPEQATRLEALQIQMISYTLYTALALVVAVVAMSTARYWGSLF